MPQAATGEEPGFTIRVLLGNALVDVTTSADTARQNIEKSQRMRGTSLPAIVDVVNRGELHYALFLVATDVLLAGDQHIRQMQDVHGVWWSFRRSEIGAVSVVDHAGLGEPAPRRPIGFLFPAE